jgi:hypothetical protein
MPTDLRTVLDYLVLLFKRRKRIFELFFRRIFLLRHHTPTKHQHINPLMSTHRHINTKLLNEDNLRTHSTTGAHRSCGEKKEEKKKQRIDF